MRRAGLRRGLDDKLKLHHRGTVRGHRRALHPGVERLGALNYVAVGHRGVYRVNAVVRVGLRLVVGHRKGRVAARNLVVGLRKVERPETVAVGIAEHQGRRGEGHRRLLYHKLQRDRRVAARGRVLHPSYDHLVVRKVRIGNRERVLAEVRFSLCLVVGHNVTAVAAAHLNVL